MENKAVAGEQSKPEEEYPHQHVFERDDFKCRYCGIGGRDSFDEWFAAHLGMDHIKPQKHGGTDEESNLVTCCHGCNVYKGGADCDSFEEAKQIVMRKREQAKEWFDTYVSRK